MFPLESLLSITLLDGVATLWLTVGVDDAWILLTDVLGCWMTVEVVVLGWMTLFGCELMTFGLAAMVVGLGLLTIVWS